MSGNRSWIGRCGWAWAHTCGFYSCSALSPYIELLTDHTLFLLHIIHNRGADAPLYAFSLFTPTITKAINVRWSSNVANLVSIPIYVVACLVTVVVGFMADQTSRRTLYSIVLSVVGVIGYVILIANDPKHKPGVSYFAIYLAAVGKYHFVPNSCQGSRGS